MAANDEIRWWTNPWRVGGIALNVIGLGGIPDSIKGWGKIFAFIGTMLDYKLTTFIFCATGIGLFFVANKYPRLTWAKLLGVKPATPKPTSAGPMPVRSAYSSTSRGGLMVFRQMVRAGTQHSDVPNDRLPPLKCEPCKGSGKSWGRYERKCGLCEGTGELPGEYAQFPVCIQCGGNGSSHGRYERYCDTCGGVGRRIPQ